MQCELTVLIENTDSANHSLNSEHGLSFYVQTPQSKFLFDCGATDQFIVNAERLNLDLAAVDFIACSHAHYDHTGGFKPLVNALGAKRLITGQNFFEKKYACDDGKYTYLGIGFDEKFLHTHAIAHTLCKDIYQVDDYCWLVGNFERKYPEEMIPARFVRGSQKQNDNFDDEICLVIKTSTGLAVLSGCAHPGILNILHTVQQRFSQPIHSVWGGTHLVAADEQRIRNTFQQMQSFGIKKAGLCHCTGQTAQTLLKTIPALTTCPLSCGNVFSL